MTMGVPGGYPGYPVVPLAPASAAGAAYSTSSADTDALWVGVGVAAAGVVGSIALLAWVAVNNTQDHTQLQQDIDGVGQRLAAYQQSHALEHVALAQAQAQRDALLQAQIDQLRGGVPALPRTVYAEPLGLAPATVAPAATLPLGGLPVRTPLTSPLPPHLEAAVVSAARSARPTRAMRYPA